MKKDLIVANRHWLVWPPAATEWMLTHSEQLAKRAKRKGWGCIEFRAVTDAEMQPLDEAGMPMLVSGDKGTNNGG